MDPAVRLEIAESVVAEALDGQPAPVLLQRFCERLGDAGLNLQRAAISQPTLHPIIRGYLFIWRRGVAEVEEDGWLRGPPLAPEEYDKIPFAYMSRHDVPELRERLGESNEPSSFTMLNDMREQGATDYLAMRAKLGDGARLGPVDKIMASWITDSPDGFSDSDLATLKSMFPSLALAICRYATHRAFDTVVRTYLGDGAGQRVLDGSIGRGDGETIRAVLWYSDLRGFTQLSDSQPRDRLLGLLDDYFECMVSTVHEHGGQVLKFTGDGILAIFSASDEAANCRRAMDAAEATVSRVERINAERRRTDLPFTGFGLGLHLGDVLFGNIGARDRLDFTVVGPAVNEVARLEAMCRALQQNIVVSSAFARAAEASEERLVSLGRDALRGVQRPQELFTLLKADGTIAHG